MKPQPTNEQYENDLFHIWQKFDLTRPVWIEDESLSVGTVSIPPPLFNQLIASPVIEIEMDFNLRISRLVREYSSFPLVELVFCIGRIEKKLGGENARKAADAVRKGEFDLASAILLSYYDKAYEKSLQKRAGHIRRIHLPLQQDDPEMNARILLADNYSEM
jgi:tRNA 2-selenouridine synthase